MTSKHKPNPFLITGYNGPWYFCNRQKETSAITEAIRAGRNVTLSGHRRIGKTGLIKHVFHQLKKDYLTIYADLLPTDDIASFTNQLTGAILQQFPDTNAFGKKFWEWIRSIRPFISFDPLTGLPEVSFGHVPGQDRKHTIHELFNYLDKHNQPVIIALDEFQRITSYPEAFEAWLRSEIQFLQNIHFIFSGSQTTLLIDMFATQARPFYQSTQFLHLSKIPPEDYIKFIQKHFRRTQSTLEQEEIEFVLNWSRGHTYYVQYVFNRLYATKQNLSHKRILKELDLILFEHEPVFFQYRELLSPLQWKLLHAIALENQVQNPTGQDFLTKHRFGNASSVLRALEALITKELVLKTIKKEESYFEVYDVFLSRWLERL